MLEFPRWFGTSWAHSFAIGTSQVFSGGRLSMRYAPDRRFTVVGDARHTRAFSSSCSPRVRSTDGGLLDELCASMPRSLDSLWKGRARVLPLHHRMCELPDLHPATASLFAIAASASPLELSPLCLSNPRVSANSAHDNPNISFTILTVSLVRTVRVDTTFPMTNDKLHNSRAFLHRTPKLLMLLRRTPNPTCFRNQDACTHAEKSVATRHQHRWNSGFRDRQRINPRKPRFAAATAEGARISPMPRFGA